MTRLAGHRASWILRRPLQLMSPLVRRAFQDPAARDEERFPPSDCWPMEIVAGDVHFHGDSHDSAVTSMSPGKSAAVTGARR